MPASPKHFRAAVLDIGSNSIKFMLGHQEGSHLSVFQEKAFTTRLGHKLALTGKIGSKPARDTLAVLRACKKEAEAFGAEKIIAIGTSALRSASNRDEVLLPSKKIIGGPVRVISGKLEGELIYAGTTSFHKWQEKEVVVIDVGGGSVEFVYGRKGKVLKNKSLPLGCVRVRDSLLPHQPASATQLYEAIEILAKKMTAGFQSFLGLDAFLLGSGGTMMTLTALHPASYALPDIHHYEGMAIRQLEMQERLESLAVSPLAELRSNPRIPTLRADVITAGCCIFYTAMEVLGAKTIHCATRGLRYGVWQKMLAPNPFKSVHYENVP
ncbi:MAG: hypothetical protein PHD76_12220 [Methylacidiphilales bacterium]|nr:hypothetical protein [Candidatus Methylacidiphilales bacterium]